MSITRIIGIILIALGLLGVVANGFSYTKRETVIDAGPFKASADVKKTVPISPLVGGIMLVSGLVLVFTGSKRVS
jgi:hypothetical protein